MSRKKINSQPTPTLEYEVGVGFPRALVIGVDEVGRGCLAGPVVAAAAVLPSAWHLPLPELYEKVPLLKFVTDSKLVQPQKRKEISIFLKESLHGFAIASCSVQEIDTINILQASLRAMVRAANEVQAKLGQSLDHVLVDGNKIPQEFMPHATAVIKGDQKVLSIACASILAKVFRDEWMEQLDDQYPGYGFGVHKGYATPVHRTAIHTKGPCDLHRKSFSPIKEFYTPQSGLLFE